MHEYDRHSRNRALIHFVVLGAVALGTLAFVDAPLATVFLGILSWVNWQEASYLTRL